MLHLRLCLAKGFFVLQCLEMADGFSDGQTAMQRGEESVWEGTAPAQHCWGRAELFQSGLESLPLLAAEVALTQDLENHGVT